jgi:hypothetical protein
LINNNLDVYNLKFKTNTPWFISSFGNKMGAYFQNSFIFKQRLIISEKKNSTGKPEEPYQNM